MNSRRLSMQRTKLADAFSIWQHSGLWLRVYYGELVDLPKTHWFNELFHLFYRFSRRLERELNA